jgi:large subunit ribosomal protein L5
MNIKKKNKLDFYKLSKETNVYKKYIEYVNLNKKKKINIMSLPFIEKVIIHSTSGQILKNKLILDEIFKVIYLISLQKPLLIKAKKSENKFRLMKGDLIGAKVTLRSYRMFLFLEKLLSVSLFRIKNFNGLYIRSFNKANYSFGIDDLLIFPEIIADNIKYKIGLDIIVVVKNSNKEKSLEFLKFIGFPIIL